MIPVVQAPPPADFDERVKKPGLDAIAERVGETPKRRRPGPKRKKVAKTREEIPPECFPPLWRDVLPDMLRAYNRLCAYLALYIDHATGSPSVDHVIPKSKAWDKVYEWSNYRLACALVNSKKNNVDLVLDPFEIQHGLFALEFFGFEVTTGELAVGALAAKVADTIEQLGLNLPDCCKARREYFDNYRQRHITLDYLERRAPFIAHELRRQGRLNDGDV
ncbi:MAG TPA: hypothetical protein VKA15_02135 [Isosphaeraceae bacterium]|nr:hypothetical protein [Isosphaeraceae bacterium]